MSPDQDPTTRQRNQPHDSKQGQRRRSRQPRSRECLLKGCGRMFRPEHPMARYCSEECRGKARQWSQWKSRQRWRQSEKGRKKRKQQSVRHRERQRLAGPASSSPPKNNGRGSSQAASANFFLTIPVIGPAAMRGLNEIVVRRCSDSAVTAADAH